jgi:Mycobacterium membrane protein
MTRLLERAWVPLVMVIVVAIAAFTVTRLHGIFGSHMYTPDVGNSDAIVQFSPKRVLYEIFGPAGTVADINYLDENAQPHNSATASEQFFGRSAAMATLAPNRSSHLTRAVSAWLFWRPGTRRP